MQPLANKLNFYVDVAEYPVLENTGISCKLSHPWKPTDLNYFYVDYVWG